MRLELILIMFFSISGCGFGQQQWEGFVYPDAGDLTVHMSSGFHDSLEACRAASINMLNSISSVDRGDYECGLNCEAKAELGGIKVCDETLP